MCNCEVQCSAENHVDFARRAAEEIQQRFKPSNLPSPSAGKHYQREIAAIITKHFPTGPSPNQSIQIVERYRDEYNKRARIASNAYKVDAADELLAQLRAAQEDNND